MMFHIELQLNGAEFHSCHEQMTEMRIYICIYICWLYTDRDMPMARQHRARGAAYPTCTAGQHAYGTTHGVAVFAAHPRRPLPGPGAARRLAGGPRAVTPWRQPQHEMHWPMIGGNCIPGIFLRPLNACIVSKFGWIVPFVSSVSLAFKSLES